MTEVRCDRRQQILELLLAQRERVDLEVFPNLFILGPQCTGTTWLYANLRQHPQVFMSEVKEPLFFTKEHLSQFVDGEQTFDLAAYTQHFEIGGLRKRLGFRPSILGEASASYAWQCPEVIQGVVSLNPQLKGIMLIRDPVDKVWSNLRRTLVGKGGYKSPQDIPDAEIERFVRNPHQIRSALFTGMIQNWSDRLAEGHLFVGSFTDIARRPVELLLEVFEFLGIENNRKYVTGRAQQKIRVSKKYPLPDRWRGELNEIFREERQRLQAQYGLERL